MPRQKKVLTKPAQANQMDLQTAARRKPPPVDPVSVLTLEVGALEALEAKVGDVKAPAQSCEEAQLVTCLSDGLMPKTGAPIDAPQGTKSDRPALPTD